MKQVMDNDKPDLTRHPHSPDSIHIGCIIRRLREISGISQFTLADNSTANSTYISTIENGGNNISIRKVQDICNALGIPHSLPAEIQSRFNRSAAMDIDNADDAKY